MMRIVALLLACFAMAVPAAAQDAPRGFPLDTAYRAISISGFDVQKSGITLTVTRRGDELRGSGNAGCNTWNAGVVIREDRIDIVNIATTRKSCGGARMKTEQAFLTSLRSAQRWRVDGQRLIVEGEAARLLFTAGKAAAKPDKKADKKPARQQAKPKAPQR
ncbi:MAG: META domain-containing protein [Alphaproteobacteria bacterium]|nr:META domain-containing protein [Alphaproteobacteria bacterium]